MGKEKKETKASKRTILREFSSGGVVYRLVKVDKTQDVKVEWLLTKSKPSNLYPFYVWRLPKGWIDDEKNGLLPGPISSGRVKATEENLVNAAIREVREEAGVNVEIVSKIGSIMFVMNSKIRKGKVMKFVTFYLMKWANDLPQGFGEETSETKWFSYEDAKKTLTHSGEKHVISKAKRLMDSGIQVSLI